MQTNYSRPSQSFPFRTIQCSLITSCQANYALSVRSRNGSKTILAFSNFLQKYLMFPSKSFIVPADLLNHAMRSSTSWTVRFGFRETSAQVWRMMLLQGDEPRNRKKQTSDGKNVYT